MVKHTPTEAFLIFVFDVDQAAFSITILFGGGAEPGSKPKKCSTCDGHGKVRTQQGFFTLQQTCPDCGGDGEMLSNPCKDCKGSGATKTKKKSLYSNSKRR